MAKEQILNNGATSLMDRINRLVEERVNAALDAILSGDAALTSASVRAARDAGTVEQPVQPSRQVRRRRPRPAVGYHLNVDKRTARAALNHLAHNPAAVLGAIIAKAGQTNRELTSVLADDIPAGKKAIESALDQLRTTDSDGNRIDRNNTRAMRNALVISKPLA